MSDSPDRPAFPVTAGQQVHSSGMTLRDWFAGQALVGLLTLENHDHRSASGTASEAYTYADALLAERAKQETQS